MSYPVAYAALALTCCLVATVLPWPAAVALLWLALGFMAATLAYGANRPGLLGKAPDGRWSPLALVAFGPMLGFNLLVLWSMHLLQRQQVAHQVAPGVWLGRRPHRPTTSWLDERGIQAVLDSTAELPRSGAVRDRKYLALPVLDSRAPSQQDLDSGVAFIDRHRHRTVLVHCAEGHGRSATMVGAWMLASGFDEGLDRLEAVLAMRREGVAFSRFQRSALRVYGERLRLGGAPSLPRLEQLGS